LSWREVAGRAPHLEYVLLQGILRRAVVRGLMPVNPAQLVDKP
jgi:hypothetical protein